MNSLVGFYILFRSNNTGITRRTHEVVWESRATRNSHMESLAWDDTALENSAMCTCRNGPQAGWAMGTGGGGGRYVAMLGDQILLFLTIIPTLPPEMLPIHSIEHGFIEPLLSTKDRQTWQTTGYFFHEHILSRAEVINRIPRSHRFLQFLSGFHYPRKLVKAIESG